MRLSSRRAFATVVAAIVGIALLVFATMERPPAELPDVTFRTIDGRQLVASSLRGEALLISFWSTSCGICREDMPELVRLHRDFGDRGLRVIAVAAPYDPPNRVLDFARERELPFAVALDWDGVTAAAFGGIDATPLNFLVDADGRIVDRRLGRLDVEGIRRFLESPPAG